MSELGGNQARVVSVGQRDSIKEAAAKMFSHNVGCLIVNDDQGKFIGLVTERDIARHVAASVESGAVVRVAQIMTGHVVSCAPGITAGEARKIMAEHRIRHLPLVANGIVVGILSARDIMGQQLLEDRAAAEEVAMLSKCLKSIDLAEAVEIVATESPKLFEAGNCVLCLFPEGDRGRDAELVSSHRCPCVAGHRKSPQGVETISSEDGYYDAEVPVECREPGGQPPRLVLPLDIVGLPEAASGKEKRLSGYLCMCGLPASDGSDRELILYKAKLTREIITAHLTNATRYQQARLTSLTDPLTGVGSRRLHEDKLQEECDRAKRYKRPFSVAIIDVDHFKMINDVLGHAVGDEALRQLAEGVRREKRAPDILSRYGGDEFVVLLPETRAAEASVLLERVRVKVQQIHLDQGMGPPARNSASGNPSQVRNCALGDPTPISLSVSCGIAESFPETDEAPGDVMRRADLALYEAKNAGRNCIRLWDQGMARRISAGELEIERINRLQRRVLGLSEKAEKVFLESIWSLVQALEARDVYARRHSENVVAYAVGIARTMELGPKYVDLIYRAAMIHDIGKIGIPDAILLKPDPLTPQERHIIEQHPLIAVRILEKMSFLENEIAIVRHHHEKWNGQGYPDGLARTAIPLGARIVAVADTLDALTSDRSYHASRTVAEALHLLKDACGYDFDLTVVVALITWVEEVAQRLNTTPDRLVVSDLLAAAETHVAMSPPELSEATLGSPAPSPEP
ncbi:MAG: diguanylate cyclase [Planctomycetes bacterium]|nr:diguanylate cyclase [Planctomycetota bacterium]